MTKGFDLIEFDDDQRSGKNLSSLRRSKEIHRNFLKLFGYIPESILKHDRRDKALDLHADDRSGENIAKRNMDRSHPELTEKEKALFKLWARGSSDGTLSRFPQNIGRLLVEFYCPEGGWVYDPFAGHNSRMELTYKCGRNYVGVDCSKEFMKANREIKGILLKKGLGIARKGEITLIEGSSSQVGLPDEYADFTITSPPYWNIEYYGDEPEQLGNAKTYGSFLDLLFLHVEENFRILKAGAWCCWFINDFKKDGEYYIYHADVAWLMQQAGFILETIYIIDLGRAVQAGFVQGLLQRGIFPKRHEYCIVGRKPGEKILGVTIEGLLKKEV